MTRPANDPDPGRRRSGLLDHLPAVLAGEDPDTRFSVNRLLLVVEQILRGSPHPADPPGLEQVIDRLPELVDPYRTPDELLPWLGSWLGLRLPADVDQDQRRLVAGTGPALGKRGLVAGINAFVDLGTPAATRARVVLDEGSRLLFCTPATDPDVHTLLGSGPHLRSRKSAAYGGLARPTCLAALPDGNLLVGDGGIDRPGSPEPAALWRISRTGSFLDTTDAPTGPQPRPLGRTVVTPPGAPPGSLTSPVSVAVAPGTTAGNPWTAYVLDLGHLYRLDAATPDRLVQLASIDALGVPFAQQLVAGRPGHVLVLTAANDLVDVDTGPTPPTTRAAGRLATPGLAAGGVLALGTRPDPDIVVGDLRPQRPPAVGAGPAGLVLLDRTDPAHPVEHALLADLPAGQNPLIAPVALAADGQGALFVLDAGLRPVFGDHARPFSRVRADEATVYRVTLERTAAGPRATAVEPVTRPGRMVWPNAMSAVDGTLYIADPGDPGTGTENPLAREAIGDLAVVAHFSSERPSRPREQRAIVDRLTSIVTEHRPASAVVRRPHAPTDPDEEP